MIMMKYQVQKHLDLNSLEPNINLARQLPLDLARRYHALPVGKDGDRITVAMADPNDAKARDAIMSTLGKSTCLVHADINTIDRFLEDLRFEKIDHSLNFLTWLSPDPISLVVKTYAQKLSALLGAHLSCFETSKSSIGACRALVEETKVAKPDIVIFRAPCQSLIERFVAISVENMLTELLPASSLLVCGYRWPIKKILLVIQNDGSDEAAINWALKLGKPSSAFVTVLTITAPVPKTYAQIQPDVATLLTTECPVGRKMRWVARRLADWEIEGTLRLRNESPSDQIQCEMIEGDHDLIIIAAEPKNRLRRRIYGELIKPLLNCADRPLLIAKPRRIFEEKQGKQLRENNS